MTEADRQLPQGDEIFLDHVGHFVRDAAAASRALARMGFAPTPVSIQANPDGTPTGTGNVCAMFQRGYIECLFKSADTALGAELDASMARYAGIHLAAFGVADAEKELRRLGEVGFPLRPLVQFQRPVETESGPGIAAFTVARIERGAMAEGRIQSLTHRTEAAVWQPRWLTHRNGARTLASIVIAVREARGHADPGGAHGSTRSRPHRPGHAPRLRGGAARDRHPGPAVHRRMRPWRAVTYRPRNDLARCRRIDAAHA